MLEDADYDIEGMVIADAAQGFAEGEAYGFLLGNGVLQPRGLMTVATAYTGDNTRAWGTIQKVQNRCKTVILLQPLTVEKYLLTLLCLYAVHIVQVLFLA